MDSFFEIRAMIDRVVVIHHTDEEATISELDVAAARSLIGQLAGALRRATAGDDAAALTGTVLARARG